MSPRTRTAPGLTFTVLALAAASFSLLQSLINPVLPTIQRDLHTNQGVAPGASYDPGFELQVAYLFVQKIEPFARYDYTHLDPASVTGLASSASAASTGA